MKKKWMEFPLVLLKGGAELLLFLPVLLVSGYYLPAPSSLWAWIAALPFCYLAGFAGRSFLPLQRFYQVFTLSVLAGAICSYALFGATYAFFLTLPLGCLAVYRGALLVSAAWSEAFPAVLYIVGLITYFVSSVILQFIPDFPYYSILTRSGLAALVVTLLVCNQMNMKAETLSGGKGGALSRVVLWQNRVWVLLLFCVIVAVSLYRMLAELLDQLKKMLLELLLRLFAGRPLPQKAEPDAPAQNNLFGAGHAAPPAAWLIWLERAAAVMAVIIGLVLLYLAGKVILAMLKRFFAWLIQVFQSGYKERSAAGYRDEVESLADWGRMRWSGRPKIRRGTQNRWEQLRDNKERVRYLYQSMLRQAVSKGYGLKPYFTPKETDEDIRHWNKENGQGLGPLVSMYERVRYGDKEISDREVEAVRKGKQP